MGEGDNEGSWSWAGEGSCLSGNTDFFWRTRKDTPCLTCRTICQPLLAARCVLRRLFDPSKLENSSRINKMCVISKCTVKQSSGGSKISETGGNPKGTHQSIIWPIMRTILDPPMQIFSMAIKFYTMSRSELHSIY